MKHEQYTLGKSLNKDWTRGKIKHVPRQPTLSSDKKTQRAKSASSRLNSLGSLPGDSDDEVTDTFREFKLTLQLFKRLTQQVREVNQCMNQNRVYNFKHYLINERSASPALRRGQLAAAMSRREIPATGAPHEPISDLGPSTLIARPCSRQEREVRTPSVPAKSTAPALQSQSTVTTSLPLRHATRPKTTTSRPADPQKLLEEAASIADARAKAEWEDEDSEFDELFVPKSVYPEDNGKYRYHDPYPENWVDETVESACYRGLKEKDPCMLRIAEFEKLQEETVLWEKYREEKGKQNGDTPAGKVQTQKAKQNGITNGPQAARVGQRGYSSSNRSQSAKSRGVLNRAKSPNKLRHSWSASKAGSGTSNQISGDESSDSVLTFRNSGYKVGTSFVPGSMYPEARMPEKVRATGQNGKNLKSCPANSRNVQSTSAVLEESRKLSKGPPYCETCHLRTTVSHKHQCSKNSAIPRTPQALRTQYDIKASEYYDIVEIARTFDPPCKAQISKAKLRPASSVHEKATIKGMSPGKSCFSQRRISLTCDENMTVRGVSPLNKTRPSTGRSKSLKKTAKRR